MKVLINNKIVGHVLNVYSHGAGEYLEIKCKKKELLVPFNFDHILDINLEKKQILLNENYYETLAVLQNAFDDAIILGCNEKDVRLKFSKLISNMEFSLGKK